MDEVYSAGRACTRSNTGVAFDHPQTNRRKEDQYRTTMALVDTAAAGSWDTLKLSPFVCVGYLFGGARAGAGRDATD